MKPMLIQAVGPAGTPICIARVARHLACQVREKGGETGTEATFFVGIINKPVLPEFTRNMP